MASINVSKDKSKLFLDFRFRNICVRKQAELKGCPVNCKRAQNLLDREQAEIMLGQRRMHLRHCGLRRARSFGEKVIRWRLPIPKCYFLYIAALCQT